MKPSLAISCQAPLKLLKNEILCENASDSVFLETARGLAGMPGCCVLLSGGDLDCSRYSLIAWDPFLTFKAKGETITFETAFGARQKQGNPLECLDHLLWRLKSDFNLPAAPFGGGAVGYLAYELKNRIETLPQTARDDLGLPDLYLTFPSRVLTHDRSLGILRYLVLSPGNRQDLDGNPLLRRVLRPGPPPNARRAESNFTPEQYRTAVSAIREHIAAGDVYQVNLSQRFSFPLQGDPFALWERLFARNPAPFYAYLNAGDHQVLCTSMERFLFRQGDTIETRPIKGTRPRGGSPAEDGRLRRELQESAKDDAELSMIVDLLRNDLGRVCQPRTIRVLSHKRVEAYRNVFHLVSTVAGKAIPDLTHAGLLRAAFPGGSITGCPKIRAMEIIDELEPCVRHVYTGCIGYLGLHRNLDLNIAIRTAIVHQGICRFSVGGGIVYDSDPKMEYLETLHKAGTLFEVHRQLAGRTI